MRDHLPEEEDNCWCRNDHEVEQMRAARNRLATYAAALVVATVVLLIATKALPNIAHTVVEGRHTEALR